MAFEQRCKGSARGLGRFDVRICNGNIILQRSKTPDGKDVLDFVCQRCGRSADLAPLEIKALPPDLVASFASAGLRL